MRKGKGEEGEEKKERTDKFCLVGGMGGGGG